MPLAVDTGTERPGPRQGYPVLPANGRRCTAREAAASAAAAFVIRQIASPWEPRTPEVLFVSSNPSANDRDAPFDPRWQWGSWSSDEDLFAACDGAFDPGPWPGIIGGVYNRDTDGCRIGHAVRYWSWTRKVARELLGREPQPGWDYALTEVRPLRQSQRVRRGSNAHLRGQVHAQNHRSIGWPGDSGGGPDSPPSVRGTDRNQPGPTVLGTQSPAWSGTLRRGPTAPERARPEGMPRRQPR